MENIDLEGKDITIRPTVDMYPYGPSYNLSLIVDNLEYFKFSALTPDDVIKECLYHLSILLKEEVIIEP